MNYIEIIYAFFATIFFCIIFNLRGKKLFYSGIAGVVGWVVYIYFLQNHSKVYSFLMSAIAITIYAEIFSKKLKTTATVLLIPALIPLVPGSGIYFTMYSLVDSNYSESFRIGMETLFITVAIILGIVLVTSFAQILNRLIYVLFEIKKRTPSLRRIKELRKIKGRKL